MTDGLTGIPGTYPEPGICTRFDYHDGPCNGYENSRCAMKNKMEREGKIMTNVGEYKPLAGTDLRFIRAWYSQIWAWVSGRL